MSIKTPLINPKNIVRNWYIVDATGERLGRLASFLTFYLIGKHKIEYSYNLDIGDYIVVINAKNIKVSGKKYYNKIYYHHTGHIGGLKKKSFEEMINKFPERIIEIAVKRMLPKSKLGRIMFRKLKVFSDSNHKHVAQNPKILKVK